MIQVNSLLIKILEKMILNRINKTEKELLNKRQKGFVKEKGTQIHIREVYELADRIMKDKNYNHATSLLFIDFKQAFDSIDQQILE